MDGAIIWTFYGPNSKQINDSLKELKVEYDTYFGGKALVGNMVHKIFNDFRNNPKPILLQSLESDRDLYNIFLDQWKIKKLDLKYQSVRNKCDRFYLIIRDLVNENNCDLTIFDRKKRLFS